MSNGIEFIIPEYITKDLVQKSLRKSLNDDSIEVASLNVSAGSNPGDNYTSSIYRVKVVYDKVDSKKNVINLVYKSMPLEGFSAILDEMGYLKKEINVYVEMLPKLQKFLGSTVVAPRCYDIIKEPHMNIIFQDLKAEHYVSADRNIGLDEEHLALALRKVAKFHAASILLLKQEPSIESNYKTGFMNEESVKNPMMEAAFRNNVKLGSLTAGQTPGYERFRVKLLKFYDNFRDIAVKAVDHDPSVDLKVLNHGDLWINNFLYKYDEKSRKPIDIIFVDYQCSNFNSLGIDLNYLFITSAKLEILPRKTELIEKYYYPSLVNEMKKLNLESIPTFSAILKQLERREMYTLICLFGVLPLVCMDKEECKTNSIEQFANEEIAAKKTLAGMSSTRFIESMKYTLNRLETHLDEILTKY